MVSKEDGYTLLEMVVATGIIALMAFPLSNAMELGLKTWDRTTTESADIEKLYQTRATLSRWVRSIYPADPRRQTSNPVFSFRGTSDSFEFLSPIHPDAQSNVLYAVRLFRSENSELLVSSRADFKSGDGVTEVWLSGIEELSFGYMSVSGDWVDEWAGSYGLPKAIKINISFESDALSWSELIVQIPAREWAHCAFDAASGSCRSGNAI